MRLNQVTVATHDVERSIAFYRALGLELIVHAAHYARFVCPDGRGTFSVHRTAEPVASTTVVYFECDDLDANRRVACRRPACASTAGRPTSRGDGARRGCAIPTATPICLYFAGVDRIDPPWRVDAPANLA